MRNTWNAAEDLMVALLRHSSCDVVGRLCSSPKQYNPPSRSRIVPRPRRSLFCPRAQNPKDDETPFQPLRILQCFLWTECRIFLLQNDRPLPPSQPPPYINFSTALNSRRYYHIYEGLQTFKEILYSFKETFNLEIRFWG